MVSPMEVRESSVSIGFYLSSRQSIAISRMIPTITVGDASVLWPRVRGKVVDADLDDVCPRLLGPDQELGVDEAALALEDDAVQERAPE